MQLGLQTRMSHTMTQDPLNRLRAEIVLEVTFAILVCLASVIGNVLVVYVVNKYSEMQTITNILIHNLALTDIIMATLNMPFWITSLYSGKWILSQEWCEVSATVQHYGFGHLAHHGLNCPEQIHESRQANHLYQVLPK